MIRSAFIALLAYTCVALAMPPAPGVRESMIEQGRWDLVVQLHEEGLANGFNAPFQIDLGLPQRDEPVVLHAVCILADFDDNEAIQSVEHYQEMLFSEGELNPGSMRDWYLENSYGQVDIVGQVYGWYRMPEDYQYYVGDNFGMGAYPRNAAFLTETVLEMSDDDVDYTEFDNDDNGVVEALFIVHAGSGAEANNQNEEMIWSHASAVPRDVRLDGMRFNRYAMEPEDGRIGVFGHELGHSLFGLPDLYDYSGQSAGIGMWSMMAGGSWGGGGNRPVHFDAWCKSKVGFLEPFPIVDNQTGVELQPVEEIDDVLLAWKHGDWSSQYFLLENRQPIGFDTSIPAGGLLIWHIDETMRNNNNPWWPNQGAAHFKVALEQADGDYDLEHDNNSGDRSDPFPGSSNNILFDANTSPDSRDYGGRETDISVYNIEELDDDLINFDIAVFPGPDLPELSIYLWNTIPEDHQYPNPDIRPQEVLTDELTLVTRLLTHMSAPVNGMGTTLPENLNDYNVLIYLESWREGDSASGGISFDDQERLVDYLLNGNNLILIGPDIATNLQGEDMPLWPFLVADYHNEGLSSEEGNIVRLRANEQGRLAGQRPIFRSGPCDHYPDVVGPWEPQGDDTLAFGTATYLFDDQNGNPRGVMTMGDAGYRIILQPFLMGGIVDWSGSKSRLLEQYFLYFRYLLSVDEHPSFELTPATYQLLHAWPNPFNSSTSISFLPSLKPTQVVITDMLGRSIARLDVEPGKSNVLWEPQHIAVGNYYLQLSDYPNASPLRVLYLK